MTMKQILIDLQEIRYYYAHKNMFDKACECMMLRPVYTHCMLLSIPRTTLRSS